MSSNLEIQELHDKLDRIERLLNTEILDNCNKMSTHIDFIEKIYEYVKYPLFYISEKMRYLTSKQNIPVIEHHRHETLPSDE